MENRVLHVLPEIDNVNNTIYNRTLLIGYPRCSKTFLINYVLLQKQEQARCARSKTGLKYLITKSLSQHRNFKAQKSNEVQIGISTVDFDDMLL